MQADNGSLIYFMPTMHPAYSSYSPYLPVSAIGVDGRYVAQPPFSPGSVFQPSIPSSGYIPAPLPCGDSLQSPYLWDPSVFAVDGTYGNVYNGILEIPSSKPNVSLPSNTLSSLSKNVLASNLSKSLETKNSLPTVDVSSGHGTHNPLKPQGKVF